jgi:radical SAM-linked protein
MLSDPPQAARPPEPPGEQVRTKVRIRFRKGGDLRLVSHHDLMTCFERMLRRAALPFRSTQGFHPKPRLVFALSLALGIVGCQEVVELELDADLPPEEVHARLARQAPPGLEILSVRRIDGKARARVLGATYRVPLPPGRDAGLADRAAVLLAQRECWVERTRPQKRRLNLRPYLRELRLLPGALEMDMWVTPGGAARPEEVLGLLGLGDLLEAGVVLERTQLELDDEDIQAAGPSLPTTDGGGREDDPEVDGQPRPAPLVPGPMAFDS